MSLPITDIAIENYRSVRRISLSVGHLTVMVGRNGVGKTNLYRALELIQAAASGTITRGIAADGGFGSVLWAGPRTRNRPVRLKLGATLGDLDYAIEIGLPAPGEAAIDAAEPMVKAETLRHLGGGRPVTLMQRDGAAVWLRDEEGRREMRDEALLASETALAGFRDAGRYLELDLVRRTLADWRFYHEFRTDRDSPIRRPPAAITTPTLSSDGSDLAAALATVTEVRGDTADIDHAVDDAFPGARLTSFVEAGRAQIELSLPDMPRPLAAHELSDGTLAYLCLVAALCGYRLPGFVALNEPEASLHAELMAPLARLIARAAEQTQIWVVTHSTALADALAGEAGIEPRTVIKRDGATWIEGLRLSGDFDEDDEEG